MLEKFKEGLVRRTIIHLFQQSVDFGKEVAGAELVFAKAPDVAIYFCGVQVVAAKQVPNFRWFAVDELGAWFDRRVTDRIAQRENASTDAITCLDNAACAPC